MENKNVTSKSGAVEVRPLLILEGDSECKLTPIYTFRGSAVSIDDMPTKESSLVQSTLKHGGLK